MHAVEAVQEVPVFPLDAEDSTHQATGTPKMLRNYSTLQSSIITEKVD